MKDKRWIIGFLVFALLVTSSPMAFGFWGGGDKKEPPPRGKMMEKISDKLDLTDEQKEKFEKRGEETRKYVEAKMEEIKKLGEKLKEELGKDRPDRGAVQGSIKKIGELRTEIELRHADNLIELKKDLTPEQLKKFEEMLKKQHRKFGPHMRPRK